MLSEIRVKKKMMMISTRLFYSIVLFVLCLLFLDDKTTGFIVVTAESSDAPTPLVVIAESSDAPTPFDVFIAESSDAPTPFTSTTWGNADNDVTITDADASDYPSDYLSDYPSDLITKLPMVVTKAPGNINVPVIDNSSSNSSKRIISSMAISFALCSFIYIVVVC